MEKKVSAIMLTLLLTSMLTLAFNIRPVKAEGGTIYIRADGSIDPPTAPILRDGDIYTFTDNIYDSIVGMSSLHTETGITDLNDDGINEIIVRSIDKVDVYNTDGSLFQGTEPMIAFSDTAGVPVYQPGWPIVTGGVFRSSPAFADINSDGMEEVIVGCDDEKVYVWTAYGIGVPGWPQNTDGDVYSSPAVADIDSDGELEIVAGSWWGKVYAWERNGTIVAGYWPRSVFGRVASSPAIGDVDQDGKLEIVIASYYGASGVIYGFEHDGSDANGWPVSLPAAISATPALADIDNDTKLEVVIGTWNNYEVYAFNGEDASIVSGWPVSTYGYVESSAAIGDIDEDGDLEIVVGDSWWGGHAWVFEANGSTAVGWPIDVENNVVGSPSLADLDGGGDLEIVIPSSIYWGSPFPSKLWVLHHNGQPYGNWPVAFTNPYERAEGNPMIGDIDADDELEFVVGTGNGGGIIPNMYAFNLDTTLVNGWPLSGEDIYVSFAAGDIDNDYKLEIAAGSWGDCTMHCWELGENTFRPDLLPWPKFHHDLWNTGFYGWNPPPPPTYSLTITTTAGGTTNPAPGTYSYTANAQVQVTAFLNTTAYLLDHWELDTVNVGSANPYTVLMDKDHTLKAFFAPIPPPLSASISPLSASILVGQSVTFTSTVSGGYTPYSYQWYLNGNPVSGATSSTWTFTPTTSGIYYVHLKATDANANTAQSDAARITVATVPVGGYSVPIQVQTKAEPVLPYIALVAALTAIFTKLRPKTKRKR